MTNFLDDFFLRYFTDDDYDPDYITEYEVLMERKKQEFKLLFLNEDDPDEIESLLEMCDEYFKEKEKSENPDYVAFSGDFVLLIRYDMWLNECSFWPTNNQKLWEELGELKEKKIKKRGKIKSNIH